VYVRATHLPGSPLCLHFSRVAAHVKLFDQLISGRPFQLVRAGRSGEGMPGRTSLYKKC